VKTTLDIPDDVAGEVQRRAARHGREPVEQVVRLLKLALLIEDVPVAEWEHVLRLLRAVRDVGNGGGGGAAHAVAQAGGRSVVLSSDPATGLPVIHSPPDAPIRSMTAEQVQALIDQARREEDLERAGLPVRQ
jgi:plasmid stability protein